MASRMALLLGLSFGMYAADRLEAAQPQATTMPRVEMISESVTNGRTLVRYEHNSAADWKCARPQRDYFYVLAPKKSAGKAPLHVVLHSAGGSGESEMLANLRKPVFMHIAVDESAYELYLDCRANMSADWWWGYEAIKRNPTSCADEPSPAERRVLATVAWATTSFDIDPNRVYLGGVSMGGSGSLGIGMCHGEVFAAVAVAVPAGADHALFRMTHGRHADPPPVFNFSAQNDNWSKGQEAFMAYCKAQRYSLAFAWAPFGHTADVSPASPAVYEFPWRSIRRDQAYPVFTNASTDNVYPGFQVTTAPDQHGQINGYFRWKNVTDSADAFAMELRLVAKAELRRPIDTPATATADVTLRRLQKFRVQPGGTYRWKVSAGAESLQSGQVTADRDGLLTIRKLTITDRPGQLKLTPQ